MWRRRWWRFAAVGVALALLLAGVVGWRLTSGSQRRYAATVVRVEANADGDAHLATQPARNRRA